MPVGRYKRQEQYHPKLKLQSRVFASLCNTRKDTARICSNSKDEARSGFTCHRANHAICSIRFPISQGLCNINSMRVINSDSGPPTNLNQRSTAQLCLRLRPDFNIRGATVYMSPTRFVEDILLFSRTLIYR